MSALSRKYLPPDKEARRGELAGRFLDGTLTDDEAKEYEAHKQRVHRFLEEASREAK